MIRTLKPSFLSLTNLIAREQVTHRVVPEAMHTPSAICRGIQELYKTRHQQFYYQTLFFSLAML